MFLSSLRFFLFLFFFFKKKNFFFLNVYSSVLDFIPYMSFFFCLPENAVLLEIMNEVIEMRKHF